jgi:hypothetical protein
MPLPDFTIELSAAEILADLGHPAPPPRIAEEPFEVGIAVRGYVTLQETTRYHRELRAGNQVAVSCAGLSTESRSPR